MYLLEYTPQALQDLQIIKAYIEENFGISVANNKIKKLTSTIRQLECFPYSGQSLRDLLAVASDYRYLVSGPNYVFYRIEKQNVKVVRVLNDQQNFIQILFGISGSSDSDSYWEESLIPTRSSQAREAAFNEVYARYFVSKPARSCVAVKELPKNVLCEIEAVAEI